MNVIAVYVNQLLKDHPEPTDEQWEKVVDMMNQSINEEGTLNYTGQGEQSISIDGDDFMVEHNYGDDEEEEWETEYNYNDVIYDLENDMNRTFETLGSNVRMNVEVERQGKDCWVGTISLGWE